MQDKTGGSAFPEICTDFHANDGASGRYDTYSYGGMTLRQYYATHAPKPPKWWYESYKNALEDDLNVCAQHEAQWRFCYADAMIAEGKK